MEYSREAISDFFTGGKQGVTSAFTPNAFSRAALHTGSDAPVPSMGALSEEEEDSEDQADTEVHQGDASRSLSRSISTPPELEQHPSDPERPTATGDDTDSERPGCKTPPPTSQGPLVPDTPNKHVDRDYDLELVYKKFAIKHLYGARCEFTLSEDSIEMAHSLTLSKFGKELVRRDYHPARYHLYADSESRSSLSSDS